MSRAEVLLKWARHYAAQGLIPHAVGWADNPALSLKERVKAAKAPCTTFSEITFDNWEQRWPKGHNINIAIRTGPESKVVGIDIDTKDGGIERWNELVAEHGDWFTTTARTGRGGLHKYALFDGPAAGLKQASKVGKGGAGIDIRNINGYLVAPPRPSQGMEHMYGLRGWGWTA